MWLSGIHSLEVLDPDYVYFDPALGMNEDYIVHHNAVDADKTRTWVWCPVCDWCICQHCITDIKSNSSKYSNTFKQHSNLAYAFLFDYPALDKCVDTKL
jgi:hypothetical protein